MGQTDARALDLHDSYGAEALSQLRCIVVSGHGVGRSMLGQQVEDERLGDVAGVEDAVDAGE